ncbi:hypothetical protein LCGC14_2113860 [marine sediment metagenome]|uniref:Uncharacterized protein n=1 Tax=marine sediment metagenome TaxID=412755 RepID=A0A0F9ETF2_9ZZZZ
MLHFAGKKLGVEVDFSPFILDADGNILRVNTDWGRIRIGNTHIDAFAGFHPTVRLLVNSVIAAQAGDLDRLKQLQENFARSKLAPVFGAGVDVFTGRDFVGRKIHMNVEGLLDIVLSRAIPLVAQGPFEAIQAEQGDSDPSWWKTPWSAALSIWKGDLEELDDDLLSKDTAIGAIAFASEFGGTGTSSYYSVSEAVRETRDETSNSLFGFDYSDPEQSSPATRKATDAETEVAELLERRDEESLEDARDWAVAADKEAKELLNIQDTGKTIDGTQVTNYTQREIDGQLSRGEIDGPTWIGRMSEIQGQLATWKKAHASDFEFPEETSEQGKAIGAYWDVQPIDFKDKQTGEIDWDSYFADRATKKEAAIKTQSTNGEVDAYFDSFDADDTEMQKMFKKAKEVDAEAENIPRYMGDVSDGTIKKLLASTKEYLLSVGSRWGVARYIAWLYYQGDEYATNEWAVAYWVALGESDHVANPAYEQYVFENAEAVLFYPRLFSGLTDAGKQSFYTNYRTYLSSSLIASLLDEGDVVDEPPAGSLLFESQPIS